MASAGLYGAALNHTHPHDLAAAPASVAAEATAKMVCPNSGLSGPGCHSKLIVGGLALVAAGAAIGYLYCKKVNCCSRVNNKIRLGEGKVADTIDLEDIGEKKAFCRCWKSEKWPYCDGSHGKHNKETGDNVGPVVIKKKE